MSKKEQPLGNFTLESTDGVVCAGTHENEARIRLHEVHEVISESHQCSWDHNLPHSTRYSRLNEMARANYKIYRYY